MRNKRTGLALLGAAALAACAWGARSAPRVRLLNTGIRIEHPLARGAWGLAGAAGLAVLAAAAPRPRLRFALAGVACIAAALAARRLAYRLDAEPGALVWRGVFGETSLAWREVSRVETGHDFLAVWGRGEARIRIDTAGFPPELRVTLERAISRRVAEARPGAR